MNYAPDLFSSTIKMLSAFGIVLAGMFIVFYFMKRYLRRDLTGSKEKLIRVLESSYVGIKKSISLIEIPGAILVVGITNDNITLLDKIDNEKLIEKYKSSKEETTASSFADQLQRISAKLNIKDK